MHCERLSLAGSRNRKKTLVSRAESLWLMVWEQKITDQLVSHRRWERVNLDFILCDKKSFVPTKKLFIFLCSVWLNILCYESSFSGVLSSALKIIVHRSDKLQKKWRIIKRILIILFIDTCKLQTREWQALFLCNLFHI